LGKNKIKALENLYLPNLSILSIQSNRITKIENLENLLNLTELYLSDNGLTKIQGLDNLQKLRVLDLANNLIERLENIECLKQLEEFWFNNNNLEKWEDIDTLKKLPNLKCLYMEHNPIYYVNNKKPSPVSLNNDNQMINSSYRRKIIFTLPNLEQLDATLCTKSQHPHGSSLDQ
jgi:protein phosphatase 1 regulatory subunit 7